MLFKLFGASRAICCSYCQFWLFLQLLDRRRRAVRWDTTPGNLGASTGGKVCLLGRGEKTVCFLVCFFRERQDFRWYNLPRIWLSPVKWLNITALDQASPGFLPEITLGWDFSDSASSKKWFFVLESLRSQQYLSKDPLHSGALLMMDVVEGGNPTWRKELSYCVDVASKSDGNVEKVYIDPRRFQDMDPWESQTNNASDGCRPREVLKNQVDFPDLGCSIHMLPHCK